MQRADLEKLVNYIKTIPYKKWKHDYSYNLENNEWEFQWNNSEYIIYYDINDYNRFDSKITISRQLSIWDILSFKTHNKSFLTLRLDIHNKNNNNDLINDLIEFILALLQYKIKITEQTEIQKVEKERQKVLKKLGY